MMAGRTTTAILVALTMVACGARAKPPATATTQPAATRAQANEQLHAVLWTQTSVEFRALTRQTYSLAAIRLEEALARPHWTAAVEQAEPFENLPPAVILDIDETVLDNSRFQAGLVKSNTEYSEGEWNMWVKQSAAEAIPGALDFARTAAARGVTVFYITNRQHVVEEATRRNLESLGFPLDAKRDTILTNSERPEWKSSDKTARRQEVAKAFRVLLLIGDDFGDFVAARVSLADRDALFQKHAAMWGQRWIVLPNPQYGSWESALFDHKFSLSRDEKLRLKAERLRAR